MATLINNFNTNKRRGCELKFDTQHIFTSASSNFYAYPDPDNSYGVFIGTYTGNNQFYCVANGTNTITITFEGTTSILTPTRNQLFAKLHDQIFVTAP